MHSIVLPMYRRHDGGMRLTVCVTNLTSRVLIHAAFIFCHGFGDLWNSSSGMFGLLCFGEGFVLMGARGSALLAPNRRGEEW
jgi:hypothetical protein